MCLYETHRFGILYHTNLTNINTHICIYVYKLYKEIIPHYTTHPLYVLDLWQKNGDFVIKNGNFSKLAICFVQLFALT